MQNTLKKCACSTFLDRWLKEAAAQMASAEMPNLVTVDQPWAYRPLTVLVAVHFVPSWELPAVIRIASEYHVNGLAVDGKLATTSEIWG
jgi:hypothetical protein